MRRSVVRMFWGESLMIQRIYLESCIDTINTERLICRFLTADVVAPRFNVSWTEAARRELYCEYNRLNEERTEYSNVLNEATTMDTSEGIREMSLQIYDVHASSSSSTCSRISPDAVFPYILYHKLQRWTIDPGYRGDCRKFNNILKAPESLIVMSSNFQSQLKKNLKNKLLLQRRTSFHRVME